MRLLKPTGYKKRPGDPGLSVAGNQYLVGISGENFSTLIETALWADTMGQARLTAIWAGNNVASFKSVMRATAVPATGREFSFR